MGSGQGSRYVGTVALDPLRILNSSLKLNASASMERDRIVVSAATIASGDSEVTVSHAEIGPFAVPIITAQYNARVSCKSGLFSCPAGVGGSLNLAGRARYVSATEYNSSGTFNGTADYTTLRNVRLSGAFDAQPDLIALHSLRINLMDGAVTAEATLRNFDTLSAHGRIEHFDLREVGCARKRSDPPLRWPGLRTF